MFKKNYVWWFVWSMHWAPRSPEQDQRHWQFWTLQRTATVGFLQFWFAAGSSRLPARIFMVWQAGWSVQQNKNPWMKKGNLMM